VHWYRTLRFGKSVPKQPLHPMFFPLFFSTNLLVGLLPDPPASPLFFFFPWLFLGFSFFLLIDSMVFGLLELPTWSFSNLEAPRRDSIFSPPPSLWGFTGAIPVKIFWRTPGPNFFSWLDRSTSTSFKEKPTGQDYCSVTAHAPHSKGYSRTAHFFLICTYFSKIALVPHF